MVSPCGIAIEDSQIAAIYQADKRLPAEPGGQFLRDVCRLARRAVISSVVLLQYLPPTLQLIILTRCNPPFSSHSLRACGNLVEIRQKDLKFTMEEMAVFLNTTIGLAIDEPVQAYLHEKIEGWAVGLRLMALSLQNRDDVGEFLREMKGDTRHIQDYLIAEVLSRQPSAIREGLLKTSILTSFCAPGHHFKQETVRTKQQHF